MSLDLSVRQNGIVMDITSSPPNLVFILQVLAARKCDSLKSHDKGTWVEKVNVINLSLLA